ncbi:MAG: hypothetical protein ABI181_08475 [Mycobacteriaceae bacterium]
MNNTVTCTEHHLVVEPVGIDKLWSFTRRLEIPLAHVRGATHDPGMRNEPKGWRGPGLSLGQKLSGTFHAEGEQQFWNVSGYENAVVVELADEDYTRLVLSVEDPRAVVDLINRAIVA